MPPTKKTPGPAAGPLPYVEGDQERAIRRRLVIAWWLHPEWPAAERRAALLTVWNAADDEPFPEAAREQVECYIRSNLSSRDRFTDEEIARFNQQRGRPPVFDPYGTWAANAEQ